jgi:hypothetical protein
MDIKPETNIFKKAADHKVVYSNVIRTGVTPFDIRIVFGHVIEAEAADSPPQISEDLVTVILAPEEAKTIIPYLQAAVAGYEDQFGKIRDIPAILEKMKEQVAAQAAAVKPK